MAETRLIWRHAVRRLRAARGAGELRILALAIMIAVAAASAVSLFSARMHAALTAQSGETLGADTIVSSRDALPADLIAASQAAGLRHSSQVSFPSLLIAGERSALAAIKAVEAGYPLRGEMRVVDEPFGEVRRADGIPAPGEAWIETALWNELGITRGTRVQVGATQLTITAVLDYEPGRGAGFFDLAPRLLMNQADVAASGLVSPTSRVQYSLQLSGNANVIAELRALPVATQPTNLRWISPQESRPEVSRALERSRQFLDIAVLAAALLAAAAVSLAAHQHGARLRDEVALLKCLGARQGFVLWTLLLSLLLLGGISAIAGALLGYGGQALLAWLLSELVSGLSLPPAPLWAILPAAGLALVMLLGFALPPVLEARRIPPIRVFQRDLADQRRTRSVWFIAALTALLLLGAQTRDLKLAATVLGGAVLTMIILGALGWLLVILLQPLQQRVGKAWRFGLGNVARRRGGSVAQVVALGVGLLALLLVTVVRQDLLNSWRDRLPPQTPNVFLINIQPEQLQPLRDFFAARDFADLELWPMARARLVELNGKPVTADSFADPETQRWINRDFNLSWAEAIGDDNKITEGEWWGAQGRNQPWLSVDKYAVERLNLKIGDRLTLQFADQRVELTVHNLREVEWDSFRPNFFLMTPPGTLEGAPASPRGEASECRAAADSRDQDKACGTNEPRAAVPAQWLTSFYLPREKRALLRELSQNFPNVTALDIEALMNQVRSIMDRIVRAVEFTLLFTLAAGVAVLLAAIEGTRAERARETALLRALGARTPLLLQGLLAEFAILGLLAGIVAAIAAQVIAWILATQVFEIPYSPSPMLWLSGALSGVVLVTTFGWISLRKVLNTPPTRVLQGSV